MIKRRIIDVIDQVLGIAHPRWEDRVVNALMGLLLPIVLGSYGMTCIQSGHARWVGRHGVAELSGTPAVCAGATYLAAALLMYVHICWKFHPRLSAVVDPARAVLSVVILGSVCAALWTIMV